jgi:hypothetical protein
VASVVHVTHLKHRQFEQTCREGVMKWGRVEAMLGDGGRSPMLLHRLIWLVLWDDS